MTVIDGLHRLTAAKLLGYDNIQVGFFDGTAEEAWVEGIRSNTTHGMPLTLSERKAAARRMLLLQPDRSDRSVAALCGLSSSTVRGIRDSVDVAAHSAPRLTRNGRRHPMNPDLHAHIEQALRAEPQLSLRAIARKVGASPETVRGVRKRLSLSEASAVPACLLLSTVAESTLPPSRQWEEDSACASTAGGAAFAAWLDRHDVRDEDWVPLIDSIPLSRRYEVIDEARRRARVWQGLALRLEGRV